MAARRRSPRKKKAARKKQARKKPARKKAARKRSVKRLSAQDMARSQREISVAEFFAKNRHLLGYDNPSKALLTAVREAVDNALDACEEAGILPAIDITIEQVKQGSAKAAEAKAAAAPAKSKARRGPAGTADRFRLVVQDNGPGIVKAQVSKIFGKLLYGSKFHRLRMSRGQQGIGISAAALYGQLTTGKPIKVATKSRPRKPAIGFDLVIDTKKNNPRVLREREHKAFPHKTGTRIELELEGRYAGGQRGVFEYLHQTALANPHAHLTFLAPGAQEPHVFARAVDELPEQPREIQPHPYGVELGTLIKMLGATGSRRVTSFLQQEFTRVSGRVAAEMVEEAELNGAKNPHRVTRPEAERLYEAMNAVRVMAPPTDCLAPIGEEALLEGLQKEVEAEFYTAVTRSPSVYRGNPFQIEVALAYGPPLASDDSARLYRFANRVPLLYQQGACAMTKAVTSLSWRNYDLTQPRRSLPVGPLAVLVHIASVWVPFTSESKEAVAAYDEIHKEIRLALQECGRRLGQHVRKQKRLAEAKRKTDYITTYLPTIAEALQDLLALSDRQRKAVSKKLDTTLRRSRSS